MEENRGGLNTLGVQQASTGRGIISDQPSKVYSLRAQSDADTEIAKAMAGRLDISFVDPMHTRVEAAAVSMLEPKTAFRRQSLPIRLVDDTLVVAMLRPDQPVAIKSLELLTGFKIQPAAAPKNALSNALEKYYGNGHFAVSAVKSPRKKAVEEASSQTKKDNGAASFNISIISNKGGVGKTHLSINLAYALAKTGAKVLLIDADLGNADISNKLGIFPKYHLMHFLEKKKQMQDLIVPTNFKFDFIAGAYGEFKLANLYHAQKIKFINHFKKISQDYAFALFDLGAGISRTVMDFALAADQTVILTTPRDLISGYACTKAGFSRYKEIEERLSEKLDDYEPQWMFSPMLVANQVRNLRQGFKLYDTIRKTADENINAKQGRFRVELEYLGAIPYDQSSMRTAEEKRKPLLHVSPHIKASQSMQHMSTRFSDQAAAYDPKMKSRHSLKRFAAILSQKR